MWVDVTQQGATGDGKTNDTQAILASIRKAVDPGSAVFFPPGTYLVDSTNLSGTIFSLSTSISFIGAGEGLSTLLFSGTPGGALYGFEQAGAGTTTLFRDLSITGPSDVAGYEVDCAYLNATGARFAFQCVTINSGWNISIRVNEGSNSLVLDRTTISGMPSNLEPAGGAHVYVKSTTGNESSVIVMGGDFSGYGKLADHLFHSFYIQEGVSCYFGAGTRFHDAVTGHLGAAIQIYGGTGQAEWQVLDGVTMTGPGRGLLCDFEGSPKNDVVVTGGLIDLKLAGVTARGCTVRCSNVDFADVTGAGTTAITVGTTYSANVQADHCHFRNHADVVDNGNVAGSVFVANACDFDGLPASTIKTSPTTKTILDPSCGFSGEPPGGFILAFTDGDTTPSVLGAGICRTNNSTPTVIDSFDDGYPGQQIVVLVNDGNTSFDFSGKDLKGNGGSNWSPACFDHMTCTFDGTYWFCDVSDNT